jgi:hypothetical protein
MGPGINEDLSGGLIPLIIQEIKGHLTGLAYGQKSLQFFGGFFISNPFPYIWL